MKMLEEAIWRALEVPHSLGLAKPVGCTLMLEILALAKRLPSMQELFSKKFDDDQISSFMTVLEKSARSVTIYPSGDELEIEGFLGSKSYSEAFAKFISMTLEAGLIFGYLPLAEGILSKCLSQHENIGFGRFKEAYGTRKFCFDVLNISKDESLYVPWEYSAPFGVEAATQGVSVDIEVKSAQIAKMLELIAVIGDLRMNVSCSDPMRPGGQLPLWPTRNLRSSIASVPIGRHSSGDTYPLHLAEYLPEPTLLTETMAFAHVLTAINRRAAIWVPNGLLFRTAGREKTFKERLLNLGMISAVIALPARVLHPTLAFSLVIVDKQQASEDVLFVSGCSEEFREDLEDAPKRGDSPKILWDKLLSIVRNRKDSQFSRVVDKIEIDKNEFNLDPERYVGDNSAVRLDESIFPTGAVTLESVAELIRPLPMKPREGDLVECREVGVIDIADDDLVCYPSKAVKMRRRDLEKQALREGDILFVTKGAAGRVALVPKGLPANVVANQSFMIIRLRESISMAPDVLLRYLASPLVQSHVRQLIGGVTIPFIQSKDLSKIMVPLVSVEEQERICETQRNLVTLARERERIEREMRALKEIYWQVRASREQVVGNTEIN
jgi:type I restriction enzyme M protein